MKQEIQKKFTLNEAELKDAIRRYFIDKGLTQYTFSGKDILLSATIEKGEWLKDFEATLFITTHE